MNKTLLVIMQSVVLSLMIGINFAAGSDWQFVNYDSNKTLEFSYDFQSLKRIGSTVELWIKYDCLNYIRCTPNANIDSLRSFVRIDCSKKQIAYLMSYSYNNGKVISSDNNPLPSEPIVPDSLHDNLFYKICK